MHKIPNQKKFLIRKKSEKFTNFSVLAKSLQLEYSHCQGSTSAPCTDEHCEYSHHGQGQPAGCGPHGFQYHLNQKLDKVTYWRCTKKDCSVRLISQNSSSKLVGETPHHEHTTNILKQQAKSVEKAIIKEYAALPGTSNKAMLCEISQNILRSDQPNTLYSMSSTGATNMALFRKKRKTAPPPSSAQDLH